MAIITPRARLLRPPRIGLYGRLSDDRDGDKEGTDRQLEDARETALVLVETLSGEIVQTYLDPEASAYRKGAKRPGFDAMLRDFDAGLIDTIVLYRVDRLARASREWAKIMPRVDDRGLRIVDAHGCDSITQNGRDMLGMLAEKARSESATTGARVARAARRRAERGLPIRNRYRAFGHTDDQSALVDSEAELLREAAERILADESVRQVQRDWTRRGITNPRGKTFAPDSLRKTLLQPRLVGAREIDEELIITGAIAPILDRATYERLRAVLSTPQKRGRRPSETALLGGIAYCGRCGFALSTNVHGGPGNVQQYVCKAQYDGAEQQGCGRLSVRRSLVDDLVGRAVLSALAEAPAEKRERPEDAATLERLREISSMKGELAAQWARKEIDGVEWKAARDVLLGEERHLSTSLTRRRTPIVSGDVVAEWSVRPISWRAALVRSVVERVVIMPAETRGRFRPERVRIEWQPEETSDASE